MKKAELAARMNDAVLAALAQNGKLKTCILHHDEGFKRLGDHVRMLGDYPLLIAREVVSAQAHREGAAAEISLRVFKNLGKRSPRYFFGSFTKTVRGDWRYAFGFA